MRIESTVALLVCLCLWIPAAQLQDSIFPPEDEESSGEDLEGSGSGSGDDDSVSLTDFRTTEVATQATTNTTKTAWVTDAPVKVPEQTVTQLSSTVIFLADVETEGPTTVAPLPHTTEIPETQPSPTSVEPLIQVNEVSTVEITTIQHVDEEETTALPDEELPMTTESSTTITAPVDVKIETTSSGFLEKEETTVPVEDTDQSTVAPDMDTTLLLLTTTPAKAVADTEASEEDVESTTAPAVFAGGSVDETINSKVRHGVNVQNPGDGDFNFDEELATSDQATSDQVGSNDGNLLERTEVLAGVIAGGLVGLAFAILLVALMVYRMKKKDEGSYSLDEHKHPNGGYQRPKAQEEFLA